MCDYSLTHVKSRPAQVGEDLTVRSFGTGTNGFASTSENHLQGNQCTAVCLLPGTELAFEEPIRSTHGELDGDCKTARFTQINKEAKHSHHDQLLLSNGKEVLLTYLTTGQNARVLQLPAAPKNAVEKEEQTRAEYV